MIAKKKNTHNNAKRDGRKRIFQLKCSYTPTHLQIHFNEYENDVSEAFDYTQKKLYIYVITISFVLRVK